MTISELPQGFLPVVSTHAWEPELLNQETWAWLGSSNRSAMLLMLGLLIFWVLSVLVVGCCASCTTGSFYEPITVSSVSFKRRKDWRMYFNYLLLLPLHFLRSMETASGGDQTLFSSAEKQFLLSERHVFNDAVVNFLSVRRSMMFVAVIFCMLTLMVEFADVPKAFESRRLWIEKSSIEIDGDVAKFKEFVALSGANWTEKDPEAWFEYSTHLYTGMFAKIISQTALMDIVESCVDVACQLASCICLWWALRKWSRFHLSSSKVLTGWAFGLLAPFLATLIPTRLFIDWSVLDPVVQTFASELTTHLGAHTDDLALSVTQACQGLLDFHDDGHVESAERMARKACSALTRTPNRHLKCCSFVKIVDFDFRPIHSTCEKIRTYLDHPEGPWHRSAISQAADLCRETVMPNLKGTIDLGFEGALERAATAGPVAQRMKQSVSMGMGFANGLRGFNTIMPAALALAPALLRGALKVKVLAPQSTIPGMFVVVLPLLYCPMTWGVYHIAFQLLGDIWMLLGLLVLAFAPMVYLALGTWHSITRPLTDKAIVQVMVSMNRASAVLAVIGYVFISTFAWRRYQLTMNTNSEENSVERDAYRYLVQQVSVLQPSFWIHLAGIAMAKYFFTTLAGVDWMMIEIGRQRHYEILMEISQKIRDLEAGGATVRYPKGLRSAAQREQNLEAAEERGLRLDCVFYILYEEVPMHVVETRGSRQGRRTVLQPAVEGLLVEMEDLQSNTKDSEGSKESKPKSSTPTPSTPSSPSRPNEVETPSGFESTWNFFFGLRTPRSERPAMPSTPWPPGQQWDRAQAAQAAQEPVRRLPAHWQQSLPPTSSWPRPTAPGPRPLRPYF